MLIPRLLLIATLFVAGCSAPVQVVTDYVQFKRYASQSAVARTPLNSSYKYILVTVSGKSFLMARGDIESSPGGPVEVWYSGNREVLRIQNGRILAAAGTPIEWSDVSISTQPSWADITAPYVIERRRDVMPGYHFGLEDTLSISAIAAPATNAFFGKIPANVHWYKEVSTGPYPLPTSQYAVLLKGDRAEVIYGEQCLSKSLCFSWQRWPTPT